MNNAINHDISYLISAEYYDLMAEQHWAVRETELAAILQKLKPQATEIIDVGSGSGKSLPLIHRLYPDGHIHAVEPSSAMRIALMTRVLSHPALRKNVSIYPTTFEHLTLTQPADIILLCGCVGFLTPQERKNFWLQAASALSEGGVLIVDIMAIASPVTVEMRKVADTWIGTQRYIISIGGEPVAETDVMCWEMLFEHYDCETLIRSDKVKREWHTFSLEHIADEALEVGLQATFCHDCTVPTVILMRTKDLIHS